MNDQRDDRNEPERIDLSALDPGADAARLERMVAQVRVAATPELLRRASIARSRFEGLGLLGLCLRWRRSILAASALLAIASSATLITVRATTGSTTTEQTSLAETLGVPSEWTRWLSTPDATPSDRTDAPGANQPGAGEQKSGGGR